MMWVEEEAGVVQVLGLPHGFKDHEGSHLGGMDEAKIGWMICGMG